MAFTVNTHIFRTPTGILKILEIVLVTVCLLLCRVGKDGHIFSIGTESDHFLAVGTFVGYAIIVPSILITYIIGGNLTILELFINFVGSVLFIVTGVLSITFHKDTYDKTLGFVLGVMSITTGVIFLIDFIFAIKNTRFTVVHTTRAI